jgi:hypothetical protein
MKGKHMKERGEQNNAVFPKQGLADEAYATDGTTNFLQRE